MHTRQNPPLAFSVEAFCDAHGIGRTHFYSLVKDGTAPRLFKVGRRTLISAEAAADWRAEREAATAGTRLVRPGSGR